MLAPRPLWHGRGLVLLGILLSALNLRTAVTSLTPLLDSLGRTFGFGDTMTGVFGMVPTAAFAVFGLATPSIAHRIGLERTALLSMAMAASGLLARAFAGDTLDLLLASALALSGMGIGNVVLPPLVKRYFADRVGAVSTLYLAFLQAGTILPALVAVPLAASVGWRVSLGAWALLATVAALPWLITLFAQRKQHSPHDPHADAAPELVSPTERGQVWRSPVGWGMALMFGNTSLITYSLFTWLPRLLVDAGISPTWAGILLGVYASMGLLSAMLMPGMAVRTANPFPWVVLCSLAHLAGFAGLLWSPASLTLLWIFLLGLGPGTFPLALTLINLRTRSASGSAALSGFTQGVGYAISCAGPLMFGLLHEISHGWLWPFAFLVACMLLLIYGGWLACQPRMLEDSW